MDWGSSVVGPLVGEVLDRVSEWRRSEELPLEQELLTFHAPTATFQVMLENQTARRVRIDDFRLRSFHRRSLKDLLNGRKRWFQPLELKILPIGGDEMETAFGLEDGAVAPYAQAQVGLGHERIADRVFSADRLQFVGIEEGSPVARFSTSGLDSKRGLTTTIDTVH